MFLLAKVFTCSLSFPLEECVVDWLVAVDVKSRINQALGPMLTAQWMAGSIVCAF